MSDHRSSAVEAGLARVRQWLVQAQAVTVLTGAGISTESGLPDYRGPQGLWTRDPGAERRATIQVWRAEPEVRRARWRRYADEGGTWQAEPNDGHRALVELERSGRLHTLVTQNVDGLHLAAGSSPERVVEVHGTLRETVCLGCGHRVEMERTLDRVRAGETDPRCEQATDAGRCGGLLKAATISFGQALDPDELERAHRGAVACDLFLAIGTSLTVYPVAQLPAVAAEHGARVVVINGDATAYDEAADAVLRGRIGQVLPALVGALDG